MSYSLRLLLAQENNYVTFAIVTAVVYDHVLTFSKEVEHIWMKPWTVVTALFIMVRYAGLYSLIASVIFQDGNSFLRYWPFAGGIIFITQEWSFLLFICAADCAMTLRVWALYSQSRLVLILLLLFLSMVVISTVVNRVISTTMALKNIITFETMRQTLDISLCSAPFYSLSVKVWGTVATISQMAHGALLCTLVIVQFVRESIQMYRATKRWELNKYINLMVKQGIIYFFGAFLVYLLNFLDITTEAEMVVVYILAFVPIFALTPRFIISIRELYTHDGQGRRGKGIDTGFGLSTLSGRSVPGAMMVFADVEQNERLEDVQPEEIAVEDQTNR